MNERMSMSRKCTEGLCKQENIMTDKETNKPKDRHCVELVRGSDTSRLWVVCPLMMAYVGSPYADQKPCQARAWSP